MALPTTAALWVESTAAIEEDDAAAPDAYRLLRPAPPRDTARTKSSRGGRTVEAGDATTVLASYPPLLDGEPRDWRLARAASADAVAAHVARRAAAAVAAADAPSFDAVTRFVLDAAARAPPRDEDGDPAPAAPASGRLPPLAPRLPAALAVAGGVNPVDHLGAVRRLAAGLTAAGCRVALLAPSEVEPRGGLARALNAALRQLIAPATDADDVTALVTWYADVAFEAEGDAAAADVAVRAAAASGRGSRSTARAAVAATATTADATAAASSVLHAPAGRPPLAFVIESVEACDPHVLGDLLTTLRFARAAERLPVVAVLGVATSALFAAGALPPSAVRALDASTFRLARTALRAEAALAAAFAGDVFPGALPDAATAASVDDRFTHVDFTAAGLARALDAHLAEHARDAVLAPFGAALARVGPFDTVADAVRAAPQVVRKELASALSLTVPTNAPTFTATAVAALDVAHAAWATWAVALRSLHAAAVAVGFAGAGDGYSLRELLRDASDGGWWASEGAAAVEAVAKRVRARGAAAARAVCEAVTAAAAAVEGGEEAVSEELEEAATIVEGAGEDAAVGVVAADPDAAAAAAPAPPPSKRAKSAAARRTVLTDGARASATAAAAAAAAAAHPAAVAAAALLTRLLARATATPPTCRPDAAPFAVAYNGRVARSLTGAPRRAAHRALTDPDHYLGLRPLNDGKLDNPDIPPAVACGDDDAVLLYRILLQCDETNDARELLARFAALHGYAPARGADPAVAPAAVPIARRRGKKGGAGGTGRGRAVSPPLGPRAPPAPPVPTEPLPGATPLPELLARFQRALGELQMVGAVGRARRRGQVRRAMFPPGV